MPRSVRSAQRITAAERASQVVALRRRRASFAEIGQSLGISRQRAWQIYERALRDAPVAQLEQHRAEELVLIDDAIADLLELAHDHSKPRTAVEAWGGIARWAERKAKLLGLDAPAKHRVEVITEEDVQAEIDRIQAKLAEYAAEDATRPPGAAMPGGTVRAAILPPPQDWDGPDGDDDAA